MRKVLSVFIVSAAVILMAGMDYYYLLNGHATATFIGKEATEETVLFAFDMLKGEIEESDGIPGDSGGYLIVKGVQEVKKLRKDVNALVYAAMDQYAYENGEFYGVEVVLDAYDMERYLSLILIRDGEPVIVKTMAVEGTD